MSRERVSAAAVRRQAAWLFGLALGLRLVVALAAASRFPPADDGAFYQVVATRIARGAGYTWAWPDGTVTYAAHYPVGYPALLGGVYAAFGATPLNAMLLNALLGALLVVGAHACAVHFGSLERARLTGLALALSPTLVLYTAALMTEGVAAALAMLLTSYALFARRRSGSWAWRLPLGIGGAALVLVRPQLLAFVPLLGAIAIDVPTQVTKGRAFARRVRGALEVLLVTLACCAPWTLRNCVRMDGCAFVSANGGWNLLIGTLPEGRGSFAPIVGASVPAACREVFGEVEKDRCFGQAGLGRIERAPLAWLALGPRKWGQLFDHGAVASSYLRASNPSLVSERARALIAAIETTYGRLLLLGACLALLRAAQRWPARALALTAALFSLSPWGALAQLSLGGALGASTPGPGRRPLLFVAAGALGLLLATHFVFFGAPRYALVWSPWLALLWALPPQSAANLKPPRVF